MPPDESDERAFEAVDNADERPTLPVPPAESGVRLNPFGLASGPLPFALVDVVVCNLSRDPRSEDYAPDSASIIPLVRTRSCRARRLYLPEDLERFGT